MATSYLNTLQKGCLPVDHCVEGDLRSWSLLHNSTLYYGRSSCSTARVAASMTATWLISTDMSFHDYIINEALGCWLVNRNDRISDVPNEVLQIQIVNYPLPRVSPMASSVCEESRGLSKNWMSGQCRMDGTAHWGEEWRETEAD